MGITPKEIASLGKTILDADKDSFGLKTDGNGNLVIPANSHFMELAMNLDRKYVILADLNHDTHEQLFGARNVKAMRDAGTTAVFDEASHPKAIRQLNKDVAIINKKQIGPLLLVDNIDTENSTMWENYLTAYHNLKATGIALIPSDTRLEKTKLIAENQKNIEALNSLEQLPHLLALTRFKNVMDHYSQVAKSPQELASMLNATIKNHYQAEWNESEYDKMPYRQASQYSDAVDQYLFLSQAIIAVYGKEFERYEIQSAPVKKELDGAFDRIEVLLNKKLKRLGKDTSISSEESKNLEALLAQKDALLAQLQALQDPYESIGRISSLINQDEPVTELSRTDIAALDAAIERIAHVPDSLQQAIENTSASIDNEMAGHNILTALNIEMQSYARSKVVLRWGAGHFENPDVAQDIDEYLGAHKTVVIGTVATTTEMIEQLSSLFMNTPEDPPDYLYMPSYTDGNGKTVPEQAISVAEYLAAEQAKAKAAEKQQTSPAPAVEASRNR